MSHNKYHTNITKEGSSWTAAVIRRVTARKTMATKSQTGFTSEAEAAVWAETELQVLLKVLAERNKRRNQ